MEKLFFLTVLLSIPYLIFSIKKIFAREALVWITAVCLFSSFGWMAKVPALRFSQAYLMPLILIALWLLIKEYKFTLPKKYATSAVAILIIIIGGYTVFRFYTYFDAANLVRPYGTINSPGSFRNCNGIDIFLPKDPNGCGTNPTPCAYNNCETFEPRGRIVAEGFRPIKSD